MNEIHISSRLEDMHEQCEVLEYDESGVRTGAACMKSKGHDDPERNPDPRRRAHFDASMERIWGLEAADAATS